MKRGLHIVAIVALAACGDDGNTGGGTGTDSSSGGPGPGPGSGMSTGTSATSADSTAGPTTGTSDPTAGSTSDTEGETDTDTGVIVPPCPYDEVAGMPTYGLQVVVEGVGRPLFVTSHPSEPDRLLVAEQDGTIKLIESGETMAGTDNFLALESLESGGEQGLLGIAFHPNFPDDPRIYINYTASPDGRTRIEEYQLDAGNPSQVDPSSARTIIELYQPGSNHNAGGIAFGPDGYLYIGMGDGGTSSTSRDMDVLLAKFLRIGVEPDGTPDNPVACEGCPEYGPFDYTIPDDNPFVGDPGVVDEAYALGFRNPWRWAFDPMTWDIYVGDVGGGAFEEISFVEAGRDYGWVDMEGGSCNADGMCDESAPPNGVNADGLTMPLVDVPHSGTDVCAIIGGGVYRSCEVPAWDGIYFFTDYCSEDYRALRFDGASVEDLGILDDPNFEPLGNGWNAWGDVYFTAGDLFDGRVYRVAPAP